MTFVSKYLKDLNLVYVNSAMISTYPKRNNFTRLIFNRTVDYCKLLKKGRPTDFFFATIINILTSSIRGKIPHSCPIPKERVYIVENFYIKPNLIPSFLNVQNSITVTYFNFWTKVAKSYLPVIEVKTVGEFKNV